MWTHDGALFFGGIFFTNALPHFISGVMGRPFQTPFAKPPGQGLSSSTVNVLWGVLNLVVAYVLVCRVGGFEPHATDQAAALGAGVLTMGLMSALIRAISRRQPSRQSVVTGHGPARPRFRDMTPTQAPAQEREHFFKLLHQFHTAMLITHAGEDRLRARPMAVAKAEDGGRVWFFTHAESAKTHEIDTDTRVHLVCQHDRSAYLSLSGHAELVHDRAKVAELWQEPFKVWFPDGKDDPNPVLIAVQPEEGEYWDNEGANKIKYLFGAVKAYVTHTTPEVAEGEQHGRVPL